MKVYLAGPLFSLSEKYFNKKLAEEIERNLSDCSVLLPQEFSKYSNSNIEGMFSEIYHKCLHFIDEADIILSILEGPDVDSGTCIELGYAYCKRKPIIGVRTDLRSSEDKGVNLMVSNACTEIIRNTGVETIEELALQITKSILKINQVDK